MSDSRDTVLANIRGALGRTKIEQEQEEILYRRMKVPPKHLIPHWEDGNLARFIKKLEAVSASIDVVESEQGISDALIGFLSRYDLPRHVVVSPSQKLDYISWDGVTTARRNITKDDSVAVTPCEAGIIETGSVVLFSGVHDSTSMNFLPENHVVIIWREQLILHMENLWSRLREQGSELPRTINMITGPSKTADIEQTLEYGVHGPKRFHVILVESQQSGLYLNREVVAQK